jgi:MFS superfamily sulfate permease-like transporter
VREKWRRFTRSLIENDVTFCKHTMTERNVNQLAGILGVPRVPHLYRDVAASLVVFLVALPLCIGVAVASGLPAELGIVTGIVGGLVVGALPGSSLQVSGPAAGLTVLVYEAVASHGAARLGIIVLAAGALQILMGTLGLGRWFQAVSPAVIQGMLAGIGLLLIAGQAYPLAGRPPHGTASDNLLGLPALLADVLSSPAALGTAGLGVLTIVVLVAWGRMPARLRAVPGALAAVIVVSGVAVALGSPAGRLDVGALTAAIDPPAWSDVTKLGDLAGVVLAFALIASAESLFSAAATDRMHSGPRTRYDTELVAQGVGNGVCGLLGALPMTTVIVRSAANIEAGARTKLSRVLHGVWLLAFVVLFPGTLELIPVTVLAGVLIHCGWKLIHPAQVAALWRIDRGEALIMAITTGAIVATNLLEGVVIGLLAALAKTAWDTSRLSVTKLHREDTVELQLAGSATFLRLPRILETLHALPADRQVHVNLTELRHLDHACQAALENWAAQQRAGACHVRITPPGSTKPSSQLSGSVA